MTTATPRARRPRPLQVFHVERRVCELPEALYAAIHSGRIQHNQGDVYVAAPSKRAALARLVELRFVRIGPSHLSLSTSTTRDAAEAAGLLAADGDVVFSHDSVNGKAVGQVRVGQAPAVVGHWRYDSAGRALTVDLTGQES